jgi:hypothetical protein
MKNSRNIARLTGSRNWQMVMVCSLALLVSACGKDSGDGDVATALQIPTDVVLNLYCADIGIKDNQCVLDDPDNPYARVAVNNDNKFDLVEGIPGNPKAQFYLWATALARDSTGENQLFAARALYNLSNMSCSQFIQDHALRAYRSVFDNYFNAFTFFSTDDFATFPNVFYPFPVKNLAAAEIRLGVGTAAASCDATLFPLMFDSTDVVRNDFLARVRMFEWGYLFDDVLEEVTQL